MAEPTWSNANFLQNILRNYEKDESIEVSNVTVKSAIAKGDNFTSDMHRVIITFSRVIKGQRTTELRSCIVKVSPQDEVRKTMISKINLFEIEISILSDTLPRMNKLLDKIISTSLGPRCLYTHREKPLYLVIEDLAPKGFRMADRQAGLDLDHCLLAIRNLAAFHASSVALLEKDPNALMDYDKGILHKDRPSMVPFFNASTKALAEEVAKWPELSPRISEKLFKLSDVIFEKGCEVALFQKDDFNVLNHGDCWINNMLFHYNEDQKPDDHIFVDFQICNYGSPALDLQYFFTTSTSEEVRTYNQDLILREYHTALSNLMVKLKCNTEVPSFENLQEIFRKRAFCGAFAAFTVLPLIVVDKSEIENIKNIMSLDGKYDNPAYGGKVYRKIMTKLLPEYDSMGLLDV